MLEDAELYKVGKVKPLYYGQNTHLHLRVQSAALVGSNGNKTAQN